MGQRIVRAGRTLAIRRRPCGGWVDLIPRLRHGTHRRSPTSLGDGGPEHLGLVADGPLGLRGHAPGRRVLARLEDRPRVAGAPVFCPRRLDANMAGAGDTLWAPADELADADGGRAERVRMAASRLLEARAPDRQTRAVHDPDGATHRLGVSARRLHP